MLKEKQLLDQMANSVLSMAAETARELGMRNAEILMNKAGEDLIEALAIIKKEEK